MAARINRRHSVQTRRKIQTSQLVNRLQNHVLFGEKMTATQVRTAERLLRRSLPDLQPVPRDCGHEPENGVVWFRQNHQQRYLNGQQSFQAGSRGAK